MKWDGGSASDRRHSADQMRRNGLCEWFSLSKTEGFGGGGRAADSCMRGRARARESVGGSDFSLRLPPSVRSDPPWPATSVAACLRILAATIAPPHRFICSRLPPPTPTPPRISLSAAHLAHIPVALLYGVCVYGHARACVCVYLRRIISMFGVCQNKGLISFAKN